LGITRQTIMKKSIISEERMRGRGNKEKEKKRGER
jgi:hypothetical protein